MSLDYLSADRPIGSNEQDLLGRSRFARAVARALSIRREQDSLVVGIHGPWGCGKSSIKNMILEALREDASICPLIVEFEPWMWSDVPSLTHAFFNVIGAALESQSREATEQDTDIPQLSGTVQSRTRRAQLWKRYSLLFTAGGWTLKGLGALRAAQGAADGIAFAAASSQFDEAARAAQYASESLNTQSSEESEPALNLTELRNELFHSLRELERPVLVVIDDIDRLEAREVTALFGLVKANGNFPNLVYLLLFSRDIVESSLESIAPGSGREFLEKIVQVDFNVPVVDAQALHDILGQSLQTTLSRSSSAEHEDRLRSLLPHIVPFFGSVRDVRRYNNSLAFHLDVLHDEETDTLEANPADLMALEVLRVFELDVYTLLPRHKDALTTERHASASQGHNAELEQIARSTLTTLLKAASATHHEAVKTLLGALFPQIYWVTVETPNHYASIPWEQALMTLQVCHPAFFDRYFQLAVAGRDISQSEWKKFFSQTGDRNQFSQHLRDFLQRDLLPEVLSRLTVWVRRVPPDHIAPLLTALFDVGDSFPGIAAASGFPFWGQEIQARALVQRLFHQKVGLYERETSDQRQARRAQLTVPFMQALRETTGFFFPIYLVAYEERREDKPDYQPNEDDYLLNQETLSDLKSAALDLIRRAASDGSLLTQKRRMMFVFNCWQEWAGEEAKIWLDTQLESDRGVAAFLGGCATESVGLSGVEAGQISREIDLHSVQSYRPLPEVEARVNRLDIAQLEADDQQIIAMFRCALQKWRQGRLSPRQQSDLPNPHEMDAQASNSPLSDERDSKPAAI